jgi:hypothetical protein
MALHDTPASMLKESLDELLEAARFCSDYKKTEKKWGQFNTGGCLEYPAGILLFSLIDSIGSYYRKNKDFLIDVDGKTQSINGDGWVHFKILNSKYFNQNLSSDFLKALYNKFRSCLMHNTVLGKDTLMFPCNDTTPALKLSNKSFGSIQNRGKTVYLLYIKELHELCSKAVAEFKKDIDEVVPTSKQGNSFR